MLVIFLMISSLAVSHGNMICMLQEYLGCIEKTPFQKKINSFCDNASQKYQCWETKAKDCAVENSKVIKTLLSDYNEVCLDHRWYNEFKEHEACVYGQYKLAHLYEAGPCGSILQGKITDANELCGNLEAAFVCLRDQVRDMCAQQSHYVFCKLFSSRQKLVDAACSELGVYNNATLDSSWCMYSGAKAIGVDVTYMLLQLVTGVFTIKLLNNLGP